MRTTNVKTLLTGIFYIILLIILLIVSKGYKEETNSNPVDAKQLLMTARDEYDAFLSSVKIEDTNTCFCSFRALNGTKGLISIEVSDRTYMNVRSVVRYGEIMLLLEDKKTGEIQEEVLSDGTTKVRMMKGDYTVFVYAKNFAGEIEIDCNNAVIEEYINRKRSEF